MDHSGGIQEEEAMGMCCHGDIDLPAWLVCVQKAPVKNLPVGGLTVRLRDAALFSALPQAP